MKILFIFLFILPATAFSQNDYITNKEYNGFVTYVRDSLLRYTMGENIDEERYLLMEQDPKSNEWEITGVNWKKKLNVNTPWAREALEPFYYKPSERLNRKREFDTRKFIHNGVKIYPDVMVWCRDSTINKSWAIFLSKYYFTHPYFENYPVYGLSEKQIQEYIKWKYPKKEKKYNRSKNKEINLTLPKEKLQFTIGDYFKFYKYTRDSIVIRILADEIDENKYFLYGYGYFEEGSLPVLNMKVKIKWNDELIIKTLQNTKIMNSKSQIDNRLIRIDYTTLDYYKATTLPDSVKRYLYFSRTVLNVYTKKILKTFSSINIKKQLKNKSEFTYNTVTASQLRSFYYWKKSRHPKKDVFEGFTPDDDAIQLIQQNKLTDSFYQFKITIPTIQIK